MATPSKFDNEVMAPIRRHISDYIIKVKQMLSTSEGKLLEIGPQERSEVKELFDNFDYYSFDLVPDYTPDYVGDITRKNENIPDSTFDCVFCMEILEHTLNPFAVADELRRITKEGGYVIVSAPLNFRIHGPVPDSWRFTEHGFKIMYRNFDFVDMSILESPDRELFPLHYCYLFKCNKTKDVDARDLTFRMI